MLEGTLSLTKNNVFNAESLLHIARDAELKLTNNTITVNGTLAFDLDNTSSGSVTGAGALALDANSAVAFNFKDGFYSEGEHSYKLFADGITVTGDVLSLIDWSNLNTGWSVVDGASFANGTLTFDLVQVPEPGTLSLLIGGFVALASRRTSRR